MSSVFKDKPENEAKINRTKNNTKSKEILTTCIVLKPKPLYKARSSALPKAESRHGDSINRKKIKNKDRCSVYFLFSSTTVVYDIWTCVFCMHSWMDRSCDTARMSSRWSPHGSPPRAPTAGPWRESPSRRSDTASARCQAWSSEPLCDC